jgi:hypothetical protein
MGKDINEAKLIGGKRKNGHKLNCICHICENMKNKARRGGYKEEVEKEEEKKMGGSKKKNGHRRDCTCPICKNMRNSKKRGGSNLNTKTKKILDEEVEEQEITEPNDEELEEQEITEPNDEEVEEREIITSHTEKKGGKKGNGHKVNCECPICKNMRKKKGGANDENNEKGDIEEAGIKAMKEATAETKKLETKATQDDYDQLDAAEKGEAGPNVVGGTRKKRGGKKWGSGKKWGGKKTRKARKYH